VAAAYDFITFDCYGTLIDWETGIGDAFLQAAASQGVRLARDEVLQVYSELEPVVQAEGFRLYRDVLDETARRVAERLGWTIAAERASFLSRSLPGWLPFADTNPALERLATVGHRLGILSNVDDDLLAGTLRHLSVRFELILTAQQVRAYKPTAAHFLAARERIGGGRWLHAAQSYFHDVAPALAHGVPVAWINRKDEPAPEDWRPLREYHDLTALADWLCRKG
jgi:2-haloalkanoic acid dehalogenase type II